MVRGRGKIAYRLVLVDTPPAVTAAISEVVNLADLVIIPTRPSPHDLRAVGATVDICEGRGRPMIFVVNSATPRARITSDAAIALSQHGTVAPTTLHHRVDYAASMIDGRTVMEVNEKCRSAKEVVALWEYIGERLSRMASEPAQAPQPAAVPVAAEAQQAEDSPAEPLATTSPPGTLSTDALMVRPPGVPMIPPSSTWAAPSCCARRTDSSRGRSLSSLDTARRHALNTVRGSTARGPPSPVSFVCNRSTMPSRARSCRP